MKGRLVAWAVLIGVTLYPLTAAAAAIVVVAMPADSAVPPVARTAALSALLAVGGMSAAILALRLEDMLRSDRPRLRRLSRAGDALLAAWVAAMLGLAIELQVQTGSTILRAAAGLVTAAVVGVVLHVRLAPSRVIPNRAAAIGSWVYLGTAAVVGAIVVSSGGWQRDPGRTAALAALASLAVPALLTAAIRMSRLARPFRLGRRYGEVTGWATAALWGAALTLVVLLEANVPSAALRLAIGVVAFGVFALMGLAGVIGTMFAAWGADPG